MILLGTALERLAGVIAGGSCDRDTLVRYINRAQERFHAAGEWWGVIARACFNTCDSCIYLPHEMEAIRRVKIDGEPARIASKWFEYMPNAITDPSCWGACGAVLLDRGESAVRCPVTPGSQLLIASSCIEDADVRIQIRATGLDGLEICGESTNGEIGDALSFGSELRGLSKAALSTYKVQSVEAILKPRTKGYVYVFQYWPDDKDQRYKLLASMHPDQTVSSHRVYQVVGPLRGTARIEALVRRRFLPSVRDTDLLYLQSVPALKKAVDFILDDDRRDYKAAYFSKKETMELLGDELFSKSGEIGEIVQAEPTMSIGMGLINIQ